MILVITIGVVGGIMVDRHFEKEWPWATVIFGIMSIFIASFMYKMYKAPTEQDESRQPGEETDQGNE